MDVLMTLGLLMLSSVLLVIFRSARLSKGKVDHLRPALDDAYRRLSEAWSERDTALAKCESLVGEINQLHASDGHQLEAISKYLDEVKQLSERLSLSEASLHATTDTADRRLDMIHQLETEVEELTARLADSNWHLEDSIKESQRQEAMRIESVHALSFERDQALSQLRDAKIDRDSLLSSQNQVATLTEDLEEVRKTLAVSQNRSTYLLVALEEARDLLESTTNAMKRMCSCTVEVSKPSSLAEAWLSKVEPSALPLVQTGWCKYHWDKGVEASKERAALDAKVVELGSGCVAKSREIVALRDQVKQLESECSLAKTGSRKAVESVTLMRDERDRVEVALGKAKEALEASNVECERLQNDLAAIHVSYQEQLAFKAGQIADLRDTIRSIVTCIPDDLKEMVNLQPGCPRGTTSPTPTNAMVCGKVLTSLNKRLYLCQLPSGHSGSCSPM